MINTELSLPFSGPDSRFVSIHNGARLRHLARREVPVQVRARRLRENEVVRGVVGAHPPFEPDHLRYERSRQRQASLVTAITQDTLVKTHLLFHVFVVVLSSITSRSVAAAAASSLMRFSPGPICRGDAARILGWSQRSSLILVVSHAIALCFFH